MTDLLRWGVLEFSFFGFLGFLELGFLFPPVGTSILTTSREIDASPDPSA